MLLHLRVISLALLPLLLICNPTSARTMTTSLLLRMTCMTICWASKPKTAEIAESSTGSRHLCAARSSNWMSETGETAERALGSIGEPKLLFSTFSMSSFQLVGLSPEPFESLFDLTTEQLAARGMHRVIARSKPGFPCRVSLVDAEVGEELLLLPYEHQPANSPYRSAGPIYVRRGARQRISRLGEVPEYVSLRLISARAYNEADMMVAAEICEGREVAGEIGRLFTDPEVRYIHLHNARRGCFSCVVRRA